MVLASRTLALLTAVLVTATVPLALRVPETVLPVTGFVALFWTGAAWRSRSAAAWTAAVASAATTALLAALLLASMT